MNIQIHQYIGTTKLYKRKKNHSTITISASGLYLTEFVSAVEKLDQSEQQDGRIKVYCGWILGNWRVMILAIEETHKHSVQHYRTARYPCNNTSAKKSTLAIPY